MPSARLDLARLKSRHLRGSGTRPLPQPPLGIAGVSPTCQERLRRPFEIGYAPLDRTRPTKGELASLIISDPVHRKPRRECRGQLELPISLQGTP